MVYRGTSFVTLPPKADHVPDLIPFDARARKALELTFREALRLGHNYIGTEHILLALLEFEDGRGALASLGVEKATAETNITDVVAAAVAAHDQERPWIWWRRSQKPTVCGGNWDHPGYTSSSG